MDDDGNVFLSFAVAATIGRVTPQLALSSYATLPVPPGGLSTGIKIGPDGCLYSLSAAFAADPPSAYLWRICGPDDVEQVAAFDPQGFPNDLAFDEEGLAYVTDPFLGRIYRVDTDGNQEIWLDDPRLDGNPAAFALNHFFGVDGIAFDKGERHLYVGNLDYGKILQIEVKKNGRAGAIRTYASDARLVGSDGLAFDDAGTLYVAVNGQDALVKIDDCGKITTLAVGSPLDAPASLVFGTRSRNKKTLYLSNFAINRAHQRARLTLTTFAGQQSKKSPIVASGSGRKSHNPSSAI